MAALTSLKRTHKKTIGKAYRALTESEQAQVDSLAALQVPHKVFKYLGEEIKLGAERLIKGTLVYIDPQDSRFGLTLVGRWYGPSTG